MLQESELKILEQSVFVVFGAHIDRKLSFTGEEVREAKVVMVAFFPAKLRSFYVVRVVRLVERNFFDEPA